MAHFSDKKILLSGTNDIPAIVNLLNKAYRGDDSRKGWTTEAHLIAGNVRTDTAYVRDVMQTANSVFLQYTGEDGELIGCVNLQQHDRRVYLGMFAVEPQEQGNGTGKKLLRAAEEWTLQQNCTAIYMTVISARAELIDWYKRHGYTDTGERKPFEEDDLTGKHLQPLEFVVLQKNLL